MLIYYKKKNYQWCKTWDRSC